MKTHHFPIVFLWFSYGLPMVSHEFPPVSQRLSLPEGVFYHQLVDISCVCWEIISQNHRVIAVTVPESQLSLKKHQRTLKLRLLDSDV